jgi:hypothetical protein
MNPELGAVPRDARMLVLFDEIYRCGPQKIASRVSDCNEEVAGNDRAGVIAQGGRRMQVATRAARRPLGFLAVRGETRSPPLSSSSLAMRSSTLGSRHQHGSV